MERRGLIPPSNDVKFHWFINQQRATSINKLLDDIEDETKICCSSSSDKDLVNDYINEIRKITEQWITK